MSDLYWERLQAGIYETVYFSNYYKYRITGEGTDWRCYYQWYFDTEKQWKYMPRGHTDRLKAAKRSCEIHNENPKRKFKFCGRVEGGINDGKLMYKELHKVKNRETGETEWQESRYSHYTLDPRSLTMSEEEIEADDKQKEIERRQKEIGILNQLMTLNSPIHERKQGA